MQYTYSEEVNSNLICCICRSPFVDPYTSSTCSHTFCQGCIVEALGQTPQCPIDRSPLTVEELRPSPGIIRSLVDELMVHCKHPHCIAVIQRGLMDHHARVQCQYSLVECSAEGCHVEVLRRNLQGHTSVRCGARLEKCPSCCEDVCAKDRTNHAAVCAVGEVCTACNEQVPRSALQDHLIRCPQALVDCPTSTYGCSVTIKRCDLAAHLSQCPFQALGSFFAINDARLAAMARDQEQLATKVDTLEQELRAARREAEQARQSLGRFYGRRTEAPQEAAAPPLSSPGLDNEPIAPDSIPWPNDQGDPTNPGFFASVPTQVDLSFPPQTAFAMAPARLGPLSAWSTMSIAEAVTALRNVLQGLAHAMDGLERRFELRTTTESLRVLEEVGSLRAIVHGLRMQVMKDRTQILQRSYYPAASTSSPFPTAESSSSRGREVRPSEEMRTDLDARFLRELDDLDGYTATRYIPPSSAFSAWRSSRRNSQTGPKL